LPDILLRVPKTLLIQELLAPVLIGLMRHLILKNRVFSVD